MWLSGTSCLVCAEDTSMCHSAQVGDGNCQFRAISNGLYGSEAHHALVRANVVSYMRQHKADFKPYLGGTWQQYITDMSHDGTWGDELTLVSLSTCASNDIPRPCIRLTAPSHGCLARVSSERVAPPDHDHSVCSDSQRACCDAYGILLSVISSDEAHW